MYRYRKAAVPLVALSQEGPSIHQGGCRESRLPLESLHGRRVAGVPRFPSPGGPSGAVCKTAALRLSVEMFVPRFVVVTCHVAEGGENTLQLMLVL
jgi:hypothetical protein